MIQPSKINELRRDLMFAYASIGYVRQYLVDYQKSATRCHKKLQNTLDLLRAEIKGVDERGTFH